MNRLLRRLSVFVGSLAGAGYTACAYGMPQGEYIVDGDVVSAESGTGIAGIQVAIGETLATTDASGHFAVDYVGSGAPTEAIATDVDGEKNGAYAETTVALSLEQTVDGKDSFDEGTWEQHDVVVEMPAAADTGP